MEPDILDTSGLICPLPILRLKKKMKTLDDGAIIRLITTDKSSAEDIPTFCSLTSSTLLASLKENDAWVFLIKKGV